MAKKKKKTQVPAKRESLANILKRYRKYPIDKCYITPNWENTGMADIIITRKKENGKIAMATFLVDLWCLGVKDVYGILTSDDYDIDEIKRRQELTEIDYPTAHNIIYGAVEFAGEAGFEPANGYWDWVNLLEEDTDNVPFIDINFGKEGKYFLTTFKGSRESLHISELKNKLGDRFQYLIKDADSYESDDRDDYEDKDYDYDDYDEEVRELEKYLGNMSEGERDSMLSAMEKLSEQIEESKKFNKCKYAYKHPDYPQELNVNFPAITDLILSPSTFKGLTDNQIDFVLSHQEDKLIEDFINIIYYEIGRTYKKIDDEDMDEEESALMHSTLFLSHLKTPAAVEPMLEILRQNDNFMEYHFGDVAHNHVVPALREGAKDNVQKLFDYLREPHLHNVTKSYVSDAIVEIALKYPEKRNEIVEEFRLLLSEIADSIKESSEIYDGVFAGLMLGSLCDLKEESLLSEIKALFDTGEVDLWAAGNYEEVENMIKEESGFDKEIKDKSIYDSYKEWRSWYNKNNKY